MEEKLKAKITRTPRGMFDLMRRHPYLLTILVCAALLPFGFAERSLINAWSCLYLGVVAAVACAAAVFFFNLGKNIKEKLIVMLITLAGVTASMLIIAYKDNKAPVIAFVALAIAVSASLLVKIYYELNDTVIIAVFILLGITIRFVYVLYTTVNDRQTDVGYFQWTWGHANYIEYWYKTPFTLPDFDVRNIWQYYHPPLHHWLMAALLRLLTTLGVEYMTATEALQMLPMTYSALTMIVAYRVFRLVHIKGKPLFAAMGIICFHPTFIHFGGAFNNDMLLMLFMTAAIMWTIRWYREPEMKNIIPLALCIGLGMMTKLSGWLVAPAAALVFLIVLIRNIKKPLKYIGQFAVFGIICVPLGLWWQVRNYLKFGVPITYIPYLDVNATFYLGDLSKTQMLFDFSGYELTYAFGGYMDYGSPYNEANPTMGLFKTALYNEGLNHINETYYPQVAVTGVILYWVSLALFLTAFICLVYMLVKKSSFMDGAERAYFAVMLGVQLVCYYIFCFKFPFSCTLNIRYAMLLIPMCAMGLAMVLQKTEDIEKPPAIWFRRIMYALTAAFGGFSYLVYAQVGLS